MLPLPSLTNASQQIRKHAPSDSTGKIVEIIYTPGWSKCRAAFPRIFVEYYDIASRIPIYALVYYRRHYSILRRWECFEWRRIIRVKTQSYI
jgi:hypothetical protein